MPDTATDQYQGQPFSKDSRQTSFVHKKKYPDDSVIVNIEATLSKEWESCSYGGGTWQDFEDISGKKPKHIYQRIKTWRTEDERRLLFISLRHETESCECCKCEPADSAQSVAVIEHHLPWWLFWEDFDELCKT